MVATKQGCDASAETPYRGRLAPSPTGATHLGHARTYIVAWLRARAANGTLILRIEDLDAPRVVPGAAARIVDDLRWLGLDWDEGPDVGGATGPYAQSRRHDLYRAALARLSALGLVYPCICSRRDVAQNASAPHGVEGLGIRYPGTCRRRPVREGQRAAAQRFVMPEPPPDVPDVRVAAGGGGPVSAAAWGGDFVLRRRDGAWTYQLAVVVDDAAMGVTEVVRGDDLLPSTPRQLALFRALGSPPPRYLHLPLVVGADGRRLAKRDGALGLSALRDAGWSPGRVRGWVARSLGIVDIGPEPTLATLRERFSLAAVPPEPAVAPPVVVGGAPPREAS
ncbi:MAG: tRNA glutamyl-Q(34) synthetase GluQRS [Myxococcota bacterium]